MDKLHPEFAKVVQAIIEHIEKTNGIKVKLCSGLRTFAEQDRLFRQRPKVTNARAGQSYHNYGLAADLCLTDSVKEYNRRTKKTIDTQYPDNHPVWNAIGEAAKLYGLNWGGNFKKLVDRPHIECTIPLKEIQALYKQGGMNLVWQKATEKLLPVRTQ